MSPTSSGGQFWKPISPERGQYRRPIHSYLSRPVAIVAEPEPCAIPHKVKAARFSANKDLASFDFASSEVNEAMVRHLHRSEFIDGGHNVVVVGGLAPAKTHIASAFGQANWLIDCRGSIW